MPTTTLEATGGQSSLDYDLLDKTSQEAIFEIYQQLQDGGDHVLLTKYEGMVAKIIRDINSFNKEKTELEQTLRSEKQKYNSYLANLESDVETQIKDVETNVKKELNEKHQRELDALRRQMETRMTELHESVTKFNEESARMSATANTTSVTAARRGSVAPNELAVMRTQVTELADQSSSLRSELSLAQKALTEYRQQVQDMLASQQQQQQQQLQLVPDRRFTLDINRDHSGQSRNSGSRTPTTHHQNQLDAVHDENSYGSRRSSRYSGNYANNYNSSADAETMRHNNNALAHSMMITPSADDSGVGGVTWTSTPTNATAGGEYHPYHHHHSSATQNESKNTPNRYPHRRVDDSQQYCDDDENNETAVRDGANYRNVNEDEEAGVITPPEFVDPNNLPEHVQFKIERFQQSLLMVADKQPPADDCGDGGPEITELTPFDSTNPNSSNNEDENTSAINQLYYRQRHLKNDDQSGRRLTPSVQAHRSASKHLFHQRSTASIATPRSSSSNKYVSELLSPALAPRSRGAIRLQSASMAAGLNGRMSGSMTSLLLNSNNGQLADQYTAGGGQAAVAKPTNRSTSSFGDEILLLPAGRQSSDNNTVFGSGGAGGGFENSLSTYYDGTNNNNNNNSGVAAVAIGETQLQHHHHHQLLLMNSVGDTVSSTIALEPERVYRVVLAGDSAVGKSSILMRLVEDRFVSHLPTTLGVDFFTRLFQIDDDDRRTVALQLWDTAGQERFRSLARRADGVLLVYDVTSEKSFLSVRDWISIVRESSDADVSIMICANKADLRSFCAAKSMRTLSTADGQQLAEAYNTLFIETSAKTGVGIMDGITELIRQMRSHEDLTMRTAGLHLDEHSNDRVHTFRCNPIGASASLKRPTCP